MKDKMTWEETIEYIRTQQEYNDLVELAYFDADLPVNVEKFRKSDEFIETLKLLKEYQPNAKTLLDIGSGNGISSIALALEGYNVTTIEPDPSNTIGAGAIRYLKDYYKISNIEIFEAFAEDINFTTESFDIVYTRQCMHHAYNLTKFIAEAARVLKKNGLLITVRDHVIYDEKDKDWFLKEHRLHKFYGGENAFTAKEYTDAIINAGLKIKLTLKHFDSPINYFPLTSSHKIMEENKHKALIQNIVKSKIGILSKIKLVNSIAENYVSKKLYQPFNEKNVPGRMYTFLAIK